MTPTEQLLAGAQALIVDWDGTVVDNTAARCAALTVALAPHDIPVPVDRYSQLVGLPVREVIAQLAADAARPAPTPLEDLLALSRAALLGGPIPDLIPCTLELLHTARRLAVPRAVASNAAALLVHHGIQQLHLAELLPITVTLDDVARGKPAPDAYLEAARRLGTDPAQCLAVDDAAEGITAALAAGMRTLTIRHGRLVPVTALAPEGGHHAAQP